jgi:DNA modification methylase
MAIAETLTGLKVRISDVKPYAANPRRGDVAAIRESLERNGQYRPIVVNSRTMEVLAGNHTLLAARELGWEEIAVTFVDADEELARRIVLVDNRTNDLAGYDEAALAELLSGMPTLEGTGYDEAALSALLDETRPVELPDVDEDVPARPETPTTRSGDLYLLGRHRLVCGDATSPAVYERLLDGERPELLWTDPPFGVSYVGKTKRGLRIDGDTADGLEALLSGTFGCVDGVLAEGSGLYVAHPAGLGAQTFARCFEAQGWLLRQTLVWVKDAFVLGRSDYHYRHEPILYGFKPGPGRLGRGGQGWYGDNAQQSVLEIARPRASREHPTMKPPELIAVALRNSSARGAMVLDPFGGSGSTLVACEALERATRLIELDPGYCDVIVARYERLTGETAERIRA